MPRCVEKLLRTKAEEFVEQITDQYQIQPEEKEDVIEGVVELIKSTLKVALNSRVLKELDALEAAGQEFDVNVYLSVRDPRFFDILNLGMQRALMRIRGEVVPKADNLRGRLGSTLGLFAGAFFVRCFVAPRMRRAGFIK
jgi:hypothetical protein